MPTAETAEFFSKTTTTKKMMKIQLTMTTMRRRGDETTRGGAHARRREVPERRTAFQNRRVCFVRECAVFVPVSARLSRVGDGCDG